MAKPESLTGSQRAYEQKRAAKAGMSLDKWMAQKEKAVRAAEPVQKPKKPPGLLSRLVDRAHQPLQTKTTAVKPGSPQKKGR